MQSLRSNHLEMPRPDRLSPQHPRYAEVMARHRAAVEAGLPSYRDPASGYTVFTAAFLAGRGWCCSSGCRHCPFDGV